MPYLGLTKDNIEISGSGYHRLDLSNISFGMSPGETRNDRVTFINTTPLTFGPAAGPWGNVNGTAVYDEIDSQDYICNVEFQSGVLRIEHSESVSLPPGLFKLQTSVRDASIDKAAEADSKGIRIQELIARLRKHGHDELMVKAANEIERLWYENITLSVAMKVARK